ncbi:MAG: DHA2 family efflux MFS transporter permease subunit, partial [Steroidobacteraceae bacterium]
MAAGSLAGAAAELAPLSGAKLAIGTLALSLATFMNVLDTSIANVSIPAIAGDMGVSPDQGTWVITSFGVANAISLPLTGWLTRRFGQVRLFTASVVLFVIASFLCGLAPSLPFLIFFRVLQGAVAGPMIPLSQSLLLASYPKTRASMALAMWAMTTLVAPVTGPLLGGWITDNISWPWIFYINVPIGVAAALATWGIYHRRETPTARVPVDKVGLGLLVIWVGAMQILLDKGKDLDWFNSGQIVALACVVVVAFAIFLIWELTEEHPIVDLSLFGRRNFWVST